MVFVLSRVPVTVGSHSPRTPGLHTRSSYVVCIESGLCFVNAYVFNATLVQLAKNITNTNTRNDGPVFLERMSDPATVLSVRTTSHTLAQSSMFSTYGSICRLVAIVSRLAWCFSHRLLNI